MGLCCSTNLQPEHKVKYEAMPISIPTEKRYQEQIDNYVNTPNRLNVILNIEHESTTYSRTHSDNAFAGALQKYACEFESSLSSLSHSVNANVINIDKKVLLIDGYLRIYKFLNIKYIPIKEITKLIISFYCINNIKIFKKSSSGYYHDDEFEEINPNKDISSDSNIKINRFVCSGRSYFIITNNNELYVRGNNYVGNLGLGHSKGTFDQISWIKHWFFNDKNSVQWISDPMISSHSFIKTINNDLYVIGCNDCNMCGIKASDYDGHLTTDGCVVIPILLDRFTYFDGYNIIQICTGNRHSLFLTNMSGFVYQCGYQYDGSQRGFNPSEDYSIKKIPKLVNISHIDCGYSSSYALDNNGQLFSWGNNAGGELGIGNSDVKGVSMDDVQHVIQSDNIISFCAGHSHYGYITVKNELYMFGGNGDNECGIYDMEGDTVYSPTRVLKLPLVDNVQCGCFKTILQTIDGKYYRLHTNYNERDNVNKQPELIGLQTMQKWIQKYIDINTILNIEIKLNDDGMFIVCRV